MLPCPRLLRRHSMFEASHDRFQAQAPVASNMKRSEFFIQELQVARIPQILAVTAVVTYNMHSGQELVHPISQCHGVLRWQRRHESLHPTVSSKLHRTVCGCSSRCDSNSLHFDCLCQLH